MRFLPAIWQRLPDFSPVTCAVTAVRPWMTALGSLLAVAAPAASMVPRVPITAAVIARWRSDRDMVQIVKRVL